MPRFELLPSPEDPPAEFRGEPAYDTALKEVARIYLDLVRVAIGRGDHERPLSYAYRRMLRDLPQAPLEQVLSSSMRFKAARWLSPGYLKAYHDGTLSYAATGPMAVCCEHPHARRETTRLCWEGSAESLFDCEKETLGLTRLSRILDSRIDTALVLNHEQHGEDKWILSDRAADGWERYADCPGPGMWDRHDGCWVPVSSLLGEKDG